MEIVRSLTELPSLEGSVVTIGSFDGIHRGHQSLLEETLQIADRLDVPSVVLTFDPHPQELLRAPDRRPIRLLSSVEEKAYLIRRQFAVEYLLVLDFTQGFAHMSAERFFDTVLLDGLKIRYIVIGYDHRFGHNREGDATWLERKAGKLGFGVSTIGPIKNETLPVSSTLIRDHIQEDRLDLANAMLGHPYTIFGTVVHGEGRGRTLNYPTANVVPGCERKLIPNRGVYLTHVRVRDQVSFGMCNIGVRPTFDNGTRETIEVNLFDWPVERGDFYDEEVMIEFLQKLRDEQKFENVDELTTQLANDKKTCLAIIENFRGI